MSSERDEILGLLKEASAKATSAELAAIIMDHAVELVRPYHNDLFWGDRMLTLDKAADFLDEPAFRAAMAKADSSTGQNQYRSPDGIAWRYNTLIWAARSCLGLPGDYVECGVYRGDMSWMVTETTDLGAAGKKLYLYDTFSGFDPKYSSVADFPDSPNFFHMANASYGDPTIEAHVRERFASKPFVIVTKGTVPDVLLQIAPDQVALLHLDLNSPAAEVGALEFLFDRVTAGGIIVFDDYGWTLFHKQRHAANSFMRTRGAQVLELPTGQGIVIKR
jgi:O-methyltransferase